MAIGTNVGLIKGVGAVGQAGSIGKRDLSGLRRSGALRAITYVFILSIFFQSFTFSFLRSSDTITWLIGILMFAVFGLAVLARGKPLGIVGRDVKWYLLFLLVILIEEAIRPNPSISITTATSFWNLFSYVQIFVMYFVLRGTTRDPRAIKGILLVYMVMLVLFSLVVNFHFSPIMQVTASGRMGVTGPNLNEQAFFFAAGVLSIISWLFSKWPRILGWKNGLLAVAGLSMLGALAKTGSRGGAVAFIAGLAIVLSLQFSARKLSAYFLLVPLLLVVIAYIMATSTILRKRFESTLYNHNYGSRVVLAEGGEKMFKEKPIIGWGAAYVYVLGPTVGKTKMAAHNTFLQFLVSFGVVGSMFIFLAILGTFRIAWQQRGSPWAIMLLAVLGMALVFGGVGNLAYNKDFWVLLALVANVGVLGGGAAAARHGPRIFAAVRLDYSRRRQIGRC